MRIWIKPDQLTRTRSHCFGLSNAVQQQSAVNPSGQIGGEPAPKGQQFTYAVRAPGRLVNAEEFGKIIVRQNLDGSTVRLKDVSRIELASLVFSKSDGTTGSPQSSCHLPSPRFQRIGVANKSKEQVEDLKTRFPQTWITSFSMDTTASITEG